MTTRAKRPTPTQVRAARRRRQSRRKKMFAIGGFAAAGSVALLLIGSLILPGLPLDTLFRGGGGIFDTGAAQAQAQTQTPNVEAPAVQVEPVESDSPGDSAAAPPLPPNPILGGVDIFYNCPDGCDDLVAQLTTIVDELDSADAPIGLNPKTDMEARILLIGAESNEELEAFDEAAIRDFIETNTAQ